MSEKMPVPSNENIAEQQDKNNEPKEIERKFLVKYLPEGLKAEDGEEVVQGYLAIAADGTEVRLRQKGDKYYQTVKTAGDMERNEWETEITQEIFESLWGATANKRVEKKRYKIPYEDVTIELDVFAGKLSGLTLVEVEFTSEQAANDFVPPEWFGEDVTANKSFKNKNLATASEDKLKEILV